MLQCRMASVSATKGIHAADRGESAIVTKVSLSGIVKGLSGLIAAAALSILSGPAAAATVVYYNLFNLEGESSLSAAFVTYASLADMLNDENRIGSFTADGNTPFGANIVGTGAFVVADTPHPVSLPATSWLVALGLSVIASARPRRRHAGSRSGPAG